MTVALYARDAGAGTPVVLLHAFPLSSAMWLAQREKLTDCCRVITPDLRGFGGSPAGSDPPSLDAMADDVAALLDRLSIEHAVLGGLSMGGYVAMSFMRRHPDRLMGVILADTKADADTEQARANRERIATALDADEHSPVLVDEVLPSLVGDTTKVKRPLVFGRVRALVQAAPASAAAWAERAMADRPDSFDTLRECAVPALVVVGDEDVLAPVDLAQEMVDAIPVATLARIEGAGHLSAVETPDPFNSAVREFVAGALVG